MATIGSILIADDEESFCRSTAELFRREGYECDCACDANEALEKLKSCPYDVLIADIKMPGNPDLWLVRQTQQLAPATPVIIVTGYPSAESAISAIELPVVAYLRKPVDHAELQAHVQNSIQRSRTRKTVSHIRHLLQKCVHDLEDYENHGGRCSAPDARAGAIVSINTIRTLIACLSELLNFEAITGSGESPEILCELVNCPQWRIHRDALLDAIGVLKETKKRFKSKDLADLRTRLESVMPPSASSSGRS